MANVSGFSIPGYEVIDILGRGGFGLVYRARQVTLDREVAIKVDSRVIVDDRDQRRFLREVRAAGRLSGHPHVVEIYDAGVLPDGRPYLVMELCPGGSLADRAPMPPADVVELGGNIADALAAAHDLGVLHRDIKPGNILIKRYGTVALADFGLAALVEAGRDPSVTLAALTPAYAAPEAFLMAQPTARSDIYALAATLHTLLCGQPPRFPPGVQLSLPEIVRLHDTPVPDLPGVPPALMAVLRRALAKEPAHRPPDAAAFHAELRQLPVAQPVAARHTETVPVGSLAPLPPADSPSAPQPWTAAGAPGSHRGPGGRGKASTKALFVAALVVVLALAGVWYFVVRDPGQGTAAAAGSASSVPADSDEDRYGIPTSTQDCPAAAVADSDARCARRAECWSGMVTIGGEITSIRRLPCKQGHIFETFAIAPVPPDVPEPYRDVLEKHPTVKRVCSRQHLLDSRWGEAVDAVPAKDWEVTVIGPTPDDRENGVDVYRCLGSLSSSNGINGAAFRPYE